MSSPVFGEAIQVKHHRELRDARGSITLKEIALLDLGDTFY
jgi:hypothetical protein